MRTVKLKCPQCKKKFEVAHWLADRRECCGFKCSQTKKSRDSAKARGDKMRGSGKGYVRLNGKRLHVQIAEMKLGRKLRKNEVTHHRDGNKKNNSLRNIVVMTRSAHTKLHNKHMLACRMRKLGY